MIVSAIGLLGIFYQGYCTNQHFKDQNRIMVAQGGGALPESLRVPRWPLITMGCLVLSVWAAVGYDLFQRHQVSAPDSRVLVSWSVGGSPPICTGIVDGGTLLSWKDNYDFAMICGLGDPTLDRMKNTNVSVSPAFDIRMEQIPVNAPIVANMSAEARQLGKSSLAAYPIGAVISIPVWFEVVLIPKNIDMSLIHELADVPRYGGTILSQVGLGAMGSAPGFTVSKGPLPQSTKPL